MLSGKANLPVLLAVLFLGVTSGFSQVAPATTYYFPQVALGASGDVVFETAHFLINPGATTAQVKIEFFDDAGNPLSSEFGMLVDDDTELGTSSSFDLTVGPDVTMGLSSANQAPDGESYLPLKTGWAKVTSNVPIWASSAFFMRPVTNGPTISAVGVSPVTPSQEWTILALKDNEGAALLDIGIAVANPSDAPATLTARLFDPRGVQVAETPISLEPLGHTAKFAGEMFPSVPVPFVGKIVVTSSTPFIMTDLFIDGNVMTSLPTFRP